MNELYVKAYPKCELQIVALYFESYHNSDIKKVSSYANVTYELFEAFLAGQEYLELNELLQYRDKTYSLRDHLHFHSRKIEYMGLKFIPFYMMKKKKHRNKVNAIISEYNKLVDEIERFGVKITAYGVLLPDLSPIQVWGGVISRYEIDKTLHMIYILKGDIKRYKETIESIKNTTEKPPRGIKRKTA